MARVGFDIDGVLYPFEDNLARYATEYGYASPPWQALVPVDVWDFYSVWGWTREEFDDICVEAVNNGELFWHGDPYEDSIEQVYRIHEAGHEIVFITSRHYGDRSRLGTSHPSTGSDDHFDFELRAVLMKDKTVIPVDYFIDDNLDHYASLLGAGVKVFLCDRPWNRSHAVGMRGRLRDTWTMCSAVRIVSSPMPRGYRS